MNVNWVKCNFGYECRIKLDWTLNVYFGERNNFVEEGVPVIPLVFKIIDIIGLIDLQYLAIGLKY